MTPNSTQNPRPKPTAIYQFEAKGSGNGFVGKVGATSPQDAEERARTQHEIPSHVRVIVDVEPIWKPKE